MKKIIFLLSIIFVLLTFFLISNCTGVNGNPTELVGTWKAKATEEDSGSGDKTTYELTITFNDDGTFTAKETTDDEGADIEVEEDISGNYYGNPSNTPKTLTLEVTKYDVEVDGDETDYDENNDSYHGSYYIVYTTPYKLCLDISLFRDYTLTKQD